MKKVAVFIANGSEEIEALTPVDVLRRANLNVDIVSVNDQYVLGSHGILIKADKLASEVDFNDYHALVIPGGMPGATNIANNACAVKAIKGALENGKVVGAICASPAVVLAGNKLLGDKKATCYPAVDFINALGNAYTGNSVQVDRNLVTANGPKSALEFSLKLSDMLGATPKF